MLSSIDSLWMDEVCLSMIMKATGGVSGEQRSETRFVAGAAPHLAGLSLLPGVLHGASQCCAAVSLSFVFATSRKYEEKPNQSINRYTKLICK